MSPAKKKSNTKKTAPRQPKPRERAEFKALLAEYEVRMASGGTDDMSKLDACTEEELIITRKVQAQLMDVIRETLEAVKQELADAEGWYDRVGVALANKLGLGTAAPAEARSAERGKRLKKKNAEAIRAATLAYVRAHPGKKAKAIFAALKPSCTVKQFRTQLSALTQSELLYTEGEKANATYHVE